MKLQTKYALNILYKKRKKKRRDLTYLGSGSRTYLEAKVDCSCSHGSSHVDAITILVALLLSLV